MGFRFSLHFYFSDDDLYSIAFLFDSIYFFMVFSDFVFPLVSCEKGGIVGFEWWPLFYIIFWFYTRESYKKQQSHCVRLAFSDWLSLIPRYTLLWRMDLCWVRIFIGVFKECRLILWHKTIWGPFCNQLLESIGLQIIRRGLCWEVWKIWKEQSRRRVFRE